MKGGIKMSCYKYFENLINGNKEVLKLLNKVMYECGQNDLVWILAQEFISDLINNSYDYDNISFYDTLSYVIVHKIGLDDYDFEGYKAEFSQESINTLIKYADEYTVEMKDYLLDNYDIKGLTEKIIKVCQEIVVF